MKLAETNLSKLLTSRLPFAENGSRGCSPHRNDDVAPTELKNIGAVLATKISRLRRCKIGSTRAPACAGGRLVRQMFDARRVEPHPRRVRSPITQSFPIAGAM